MGKEGSGSLRTKRGTKIRDKVECMQSLNYLILLNMERETTAMAWGPELMRIGDTMDIKRAK
jgi:hypothetical protein